MESSSSSPSLQIHDLEKNDEETIKKTEDLPINRYKEMMSTLPREKNWANSIEDFYQYQGFWYMDFILEGVLSVQENFKAKPTDIILASFMKTGTTWLKSMAFAIITRLSFDLSTNTSPLYTKGPHECIPFLEYDKMEKIIEIPLLGTHIPYTSLPKSILDCGCKIVYIWRDPKDVFISLWFFLGKIFMYSNDEPIPLEEAFELFCKGIVTNGPYWDHVLSYWKAKLEFPEKVLFLKYEEMKDDTYFYVKTLAEFMDYPFTIEEEENEVVQKIVNMCSFENMSNLEVNKNGKYHSSASVPIDNNAFFRKGKVGDWENYLTPEMGTVWM
ncbi:hypothetical protein JCGZ_11779 [Jatropha curcas]|uniref:Sulfotransferase n=1 Tax=Jatropha curcas TaxID=180498 RepID=A0A067K8R1_JATCU|nr:hypothetical protein JCGZ_11779 [Jatropha curcas]